MKRLFILSLVFSVLIVVPAGAQVSKFLKNVKNAVADDLLGKNNNSNSKPAQEPSCACDPADLIVDLGKYQIGYNEINIDVLANGNIIIQDKMTQKYYLVKDGVTEGPIKEHDPRLKQFEKIVAEDDAQAAMLALYKDYITKEGERYVIKFAGKTYGPYDLINDFKLTRSKDKFVAYVTETMAVTEKEGKKMEEAMNNAKTDQERMDLGMKYAQQMQQRMLASGDPTSIKPKFVSNLPVNNDMLGFFTANTMMKYDDIVLINESKITDLQGKTLFNLPMSQYDAASTFISTDNSRYATYSYGTLTISDGKKLSELFNPSLARVEGKVYLSYMYYSPKRDAIMQCKIPF